MIYDLGRWFWAKWVIYHCTFIGLPILLYYFLSWVYDSSKPSIGNAIISLSSSPACFWYFEIFPILKSGWIQCYTATKNRLKKMKS